MFGGATYLIDRGQTALQAAIAYRPGLRQRITDFLLRYPTAFYLVAVELLTFAIVVGMLTGLNSHYFVVFFGVTIGLGTVVFRYRQIANLFTVGVSILRDLNLHPHSILPERKTEYLPVLGPRETNP